MFFTNSPWTDCPSNNYDRSNIIAHGYPTGRTRSLGKTAIETSRRLGDTVRQLCLGGLAAIWVLKRDTRGGFGLAYSLKIATALLITTLLIDVLHGAVFFWLTQDKLAIAKGHPGSLFWQKLDKPGFTHVNGGVAACYVCSEFCRFAVLRDSCALKHLCTLTKSDRAKIIAAFVLEQMRILDAHLLKQKNKEAPLMPKFLMFGTDSRLQLIDDLAAIAELDVVDSDNVRSFEAAWQGQTLRVETPLIRDQDLIESRASDANFLLLVVSQADGPMPADLQELEAIPDRVELAGVCFTNLIDDPELVQLVQLDITEIVRRKRPRWKERFLIEDCDIFFHILKTSFFTDCL